MEVILAGLAIIIVHYNYLVQSGDAFALFNEKIMLLYAFMSLTISIRTKFADMLELNDKNYRMIRTDLLSLLKQYEPKNHSEDFDIKFTSNSVVRFQMFSGKIFLTLRYVENENSVNEKSISVSFLLDSTNIKVLSCDSGMLIVNNDVSIKISGNKEDLQRIIDDFDRFIHSN